MTRPAPHVLTEDGIDPKEESCGYCFITYNKSLGQCPECAAEGRPVGHTFRGELIEARDEWMRRAGAVKVRWLTGVA